MADEKIVKTDNQPEEKVQKSAKDGKDAKPAKKKGRGLGKRIAKYFRDLRGEFKKIIWPTFPSAAQYRCDAGDVRDHGPGHLCHRFRPGQTDPITRVVGLIPCGSRQGGLVDVRGSEMVCMPYLFRL